MWGPLRAALLAGTFEERAQRRLNRLGCDAGPADGSIGPWSRSAIIRFQAANGLHDAHEAKTPFCFSGLSHRRRPPLIGPTGPAVERDEIDVRLRRPGILFERPPVPGDGLVEPALIGPPAVSRQQVRLAPRAAGGRRLLRAVDPAEAARSCADGAPPAPGAVRARERLAPAN